MDRLKSKILKYNKEMKLVIVIKMKMMKNNQIKLLRISKKNKINSHKLINNRVYHKILHLFRKKKS